MSHSILEYLEHIQKEAVYLQKRSKGLQFKEFIDNETITRAFVRSLEIIGEASTNLPRTFKEVFAKPYALCKRSTPKL